MLKHIVMWKFKDTAEGKTKEENINEIEKRLMEIKAELPIIKQIAFNRCAVLDDSFYDAVLEMEFESIEDLSFYQEYPKHRDLSAFVKSVRVKRACVDYFMDQA